MWVMRCRAISYIVVVASLTLQAGCGGGSSAGAPSGSTNTQTMGPVRFTYSGRSFQETAATSNSVSVTGAAGAAFSQLTFNPAPNLADTVIAYDEGDQLLLYHCATGNSTFLQTNLVYAYQPSCSADGRIAFVGLDPASGNYQIFTCYQDGSHVTRITSAAYNHSNPSWGPMNRKIVFENSSNSAIATIPSTGGTETALGIKGDYPSYSPDGNSIIYTKTAAKELYLYNTSTKAASLFFDSDAPTFGVFAPNDAEILAAVAISGNTDIAILNTSGLGIQLTGGATDFHPTGSPDSTQVAFVRISGSQTYLDTAPMYLGASPTVIASADALGDTPQDPSWSPFLGSQEFIGTGAPMGISAAGFLWSQAGTSFAGLVSFGATTPSKATVTPQTTGNGAAIVELIAADEVTTLSYTNSYYVPPVSVTVDSPQVLVSFDPTTGQIATVASFVSMKKGASTRDASRLVFNGTFTGVYDRTGKNIAPGGGSQLVLNAKTGAMVAG